MLWKLEKFDLHVDTNPAKVYHHGVCYFWLLHSILIPAGHCFSASFMKYIKIASQVMRWSLRATNKIANSHPPSSQDGRPAPIMLNMKHIILYLVFVYVPGADPGFFLGGGALVSCSTSTPINHIVFFFFWQNTSCIRKPHVISGEGGGGGAHLLHPPPRSAPACNNESKKIQAQQFIREA